MPVNDIDTLRKSSIVKRIVSVRFDGVADYYILKVRVELVNGWFMDCWEHRTANIERYSFHVFRDGKMIVRWDNSPHHPEVKSFPQHKHLGEEITDSRKMAVEDVLSELERMMR